MGEIDENEDISGKNCAIEFPVRKITYEGEIHSNQIHGKGQMVHQESGNAFQGQFVNGYKHGPGKFILKEAS
jgi:hypothetical protein